MCGYWAWKVEQPGNSPVPRFRCLQDSCCYKWSLVGVIYSVDLSGVTAFEVKQSRTDWDAYVVSNTASNLRVRDLNLFLNTLMEDCKTKNEFKNPIMN